MEGFEYFDEVDDLFQGITLYEPPPLLAASPRSPYVSGDSNIPPELRFTELATVEDNPHYSRSEPTEQGDGSVPTTTDVVAPNSQGTVKR